jgi:hypothetical protein
MGDQTSLGSTHCVDPSPKRAGERREKRGWPQTAFLRGYGLTVWRWRRASGAPRALAWRGVRGGEGGASLPNPQHGVFKPTLTHTTQETPLRHLAAQQLHQPDVCPACMSCPPAPMPPPRVCFHHRKCPITHTVPAAPMPALCPLLQVGVSQPSGQQNEADGSSKHCVVGIATPFWQHWPQPWQPPWQPWCVLSTAAGAASTTAGADAAGWSHAWKP